MAHHHAALLFAVGAWLLVSRATAQVPASEGIQLDDLPVFNPERPPDFWDDASVIDVPAGGDLRAVLEPIQENWVKTVIRLAPGDHYMPQEMQLRIRMTGHTQVIGQGMNVTFLYWNAFQAVGVIEVAATVEFNSLTHVGFVTGSLAFADITNVGGNFPALPLLYQIHTETWAGCDDLDCFRPVKLPSQDCPGNYPNGCTLGLITAAQAKFARLGLLRYLWGNITGVEYTIRTIYFPPEQGYFTWAVKNAISVSIVTIVYFDSMTRLRPDLPIMENMFNWLKERQPNYAGRTDCYNPFDSDFGFTYRGNASRASNNAPCLRWDDPSIDLYNFYYPSRGNFTSVEENYCRNPRFLQFGDPGPWCNIRTGTGGITMQSCGIPECAIPKPASPEDHTRSIAGGVAAACAVLLLAVILFTWYWRKIYPARKLQAWHVKEPFETVKEIPPARLLKAKTPPLKRAPQPGSEASGSQVCKETRLLLASGVQIDSIAAADLQVKFGREWSRQNVIDTSRLVGTGSVGQVYAGTRNGEPVAYKIMNQMKPCEGMVRFMQKYVLPVVQVQHEPGFPLHHPHLLPLIDCLMFPPWYSLLALASDAGIPKYASQERKAKEQEKMREHLKQLNERHKVVIEQSAGNNGSLELSAVFLPHNPAGQPTPDPTTDSGKSFSRQVSPDNHVSTPPSAMAISGVTSAQTSMADSGTSSWRVAELRPALGWHPGSGGNQVPLKCDPPIPEVPSQPSNSSTASASAGASPPRSLSPAPGCDPKDASWEAVPALMLEPLRGEESWLETQPHQPDSPVGVNILSPFDAADDSCDGGRDKADEPSTSCQGEDATQESPHHWSSLLAAAESIKDGSGKGGSNNPRKTEGGATERGTTERDGPNHSSEGKPVTNDRKLAIVSQVIMIAPLCELGTLSALIDGRTKIPAWCIPQDLCQRLATQLAVDVRVSISEDTPEPTNSIPGNATVTIRDLPVLWQLVLKLQVCLQVVEGVMALHKAQLVHCDIKPENIFLTAKSGFQPFAVCAKIGDMDTCRSIAPGRQGAGSPRSPTGTGYGLGLNSASVDPYFTTCLKGTPGYLAPEMILQGKVAPSTDLFSLAITIAIMLAKRHRFIQYDNLHMRSVPEFSELIDVQLAKLLGACTLTDPNARPTIMQLKTQLRSQFYKTLSQATASLA